MRIDGKSIANEILTNLAKDVDRLGASGVQPTLAVLLVGDNPASLAYIKQKQKAAGQIGATVIFSHQAATISHDALHAIVNQFNTDPTVHGLIIQRPVPKNADDISDVLNAVALKKDVDGFLPGSPFDVPVAAAVGEILRNVKSQIEKIKSTDLNDEKLFGWLRTQNIVIIGRGGTAGKPIADFLQKQGCATSVVHSQTPEPDKMMKQADIIVSCVGKERIVTKEVVKTGVILISVGIWRDGEGNLRGDYEEEDIADIASFYTPTPGGVGPVNVACLMQNLVIAASRHANSDVLMY